MFGGRGITRTGMGAGGERFQKTYKYAAILGGSSGILIIRCSLEQVTHDFAHCPARLVQLFVERRGRAKGKVETFCLPLIKVIGGSFYVSLRQGPARHSRLI